MATTYTSSLGLALPTTGELSGTWGDTVNNYLTTYVDTAVAGQLTISLTGDLSLSKTTGTSLGSTSSQYAILNVTPSASTWTITVPAASQIYHINNLSSTYTFSFKASGGTAITVAAAEKCVVAYNGSNFVRVSSTSIFGSPSTAMTLDTSGNLGLGTTPSAWNTSAKAYTNAAGSFYNVNTTLAGIIQNAYLDSGGIYKYVNTGEASYFVQNAGIFTWASVASGSGGATASLTEKMRLDSSGNLGIGTSSPFNVANQTCVTVNGTNVGRIELWSGGTSRGYFAGLSGEMRLAASSTNPLTFEINSAEKMRLDSSGNLGLGQVPAVRKFEINAIPATTSQLNGIRVQMNGVATSASEFLLGTDSGGIPYTSIRTGNDGNAWMSFFTGSGPTERMRLDSSGNLGIGTTSVTNGAGWDKLVQIYATNYPVLSLKNSYRQWDTTVYGSSGALVFYDVTAAAERMRLDSSGNLLVGGTNTYCANTATGTLIGNNGLIYSQASGFKSMLGKSAQVTGNGGGYDYNLIATLPASSGSTADYIHLRVIVNTTWSAASTGRYEIILGNRNGFSYSWQVLKGLTGITGIVCYQTSGVTYIYARNQDTYSYSCVDVLSSNNATLYEQSWTKTTPSGTIIFDTNDTTTYPPAYFSDSSGNFMVGTTTTPSSTQSGFYVNQYGILGSVPSGNVNAAWYKPSGASGVDYHRFIVGGNQYGAISWNGATGTLYTTTSDYRLKENVQPMQNALEVVSRLKPVTYSWKEGNTTGQGFIAHELQEVMPDAVSGKKDGVETYKDEEGNEQTRPQYQGIDTSFLVATLTAALQEAHSLIKDLQTRVAQLEAK